MLQALMALKGKDIFQSLLKGDIHPIDAKRWKVTVDDDPKGYVVSSHKVGADEVGAWAKWVFKYADDNDDATPEIEESVQSWYTKTGGHVIDLNGKPVEKDSVVARITTVGFPPKVVVIITHRFVDGDGNPRTYRFDGKL